MTGRGLPELAGPAIARVARHRGQDIEPMFRRQRQLHLMEERS
jgi:hypothetical protein